MKRRRRQKKQNERVRTAAPGGGTAQERHPGRFRFETPLRNLKIIDISSKKGRLYCPVGVCSLRFKDLDIFFWRARVCWQLLCLCRPFLYF